MIEWVKTKDIPPPIGRIVKRWKNGSVWVGYYNSTEKESNFEEYIVLPQEPK